MNKLLQSLLFLFLLGVPAFGQGMDPEIFLKAIPSGFDVIDMDHDVDGNTYVLGSRAGDGVIVRYDSAGRTSADEDIVIAGFVPVAFDVVGRESDGAIFFASSRVVYKYDLATGTRTQVASVGFANIKDVVFASATNKLMVGVEGPNYPPLVMVLSGGGTTFENWMIFEEAGWSGTNRATLRSITADDVGNVYLVGETASTVPAAPSNSWTPSGPMAAAGQATLAGNTRYLAKLNANLAEYSIRQPAGFNNLFDVTYRNGWVYVMGKSSAAPTSAVRVQRFDTSLVASKSSVISSPDYANLVPATAAKMKKFSLSADALDNVYITGYTQNGTTKFFPDGTTTDEYQSIASTSESAFVAKLDSGFEYQWVKTPIQSPFPTMGARLKVAWDGENSRLWWSGSFQGANGMTMQEAADASSAKSLPIESGNLQGFSAVFEPDGAFTEVVDFTLSTPYAGNRVLLNGSVLENPGEALSLILDSSITIQSPRTVYQWHESPTPEDLETDDIEGKEVTIDNADTRYSFINFSVNSVVQDSNATVYTFSLSEQTTVQLEWLVEYALRVDSYLDDTNSHATVPPSNLPYVKALDSKASGNPAPAVGKHWIEEDSPVVMEINGAVEDLAAHPGLAIRYVPWRYRATGAATDTTGGGGSKTFATVEPRQQLDEFSMTGPATVTYDWKLQYGVDMTATNLAANADLLVEFKTAPPTPTTPQADFEGSGVAWYDDGTTVRIAAPRTLAVGGGLLDLAGWINGDNHIFSPAEGTFDPTLSNPFTSEQTDAGFSIFQHNGEDFIGLEVVLERPARAVWDYGAKVLLKTVNIGNYVEFTDDEIAEFGLEIGGQPTLVSGGGRSGARWERCGHRRGFHLG
jgi:hypothetical protein